MTEERMDELAHIDNLDDYSLMHVFDFLTIRDLIVIERVSKKWRDLSLKSWSRRNTLILHRELGLKFPLENHLEDILKRGGKYLTYLNLEGLWGLNAGAILNILYTKTSDADVNGRLWSLYGIGKVLKAVKGNRPFDTCDYDDGDDIPEFPFKKYELISKYCSNLKKLKMKFREEWNLSDLNSLTDSVVNNLTHCTLKIQMPENEKHYVGEIKSFFKRATSLEEFQMTTILDQNLDFYSEVPDKCKVLKFDTCLIFPTALMRVIERLPNLEKLSIYGAGFSFKCVHTISHQLKSLKVEGGGFPTGEIDIVKNMPFENLCSLKLVNIGGVDDEFVSVFVSKCPLLEVINLAGCKDITDLGFQQLTKLSNLKVLDVNNTNFGSIYLENGNNLKKFHCSGCKRVTSSDLIKLIKMCSELSYLDIYFFEEELTSKFFRKVLEIVESRPNHVSLSIDFHLRVKDTTKLGLSSRNNRSLKYNYVKIVGNYETLSELEEKWWNPTHKVYYVDSREATVQAGKGEEPLEN